MRFINKRRRISFVIIWMDRGSFEEARDDERRNRVLPGRNIFVSHLIYPEATIVNDSSDPTGDILLEL